MIKYISVALIIILATTVLYYLEKLYISHKANKTVKTILQMAEKGELDPRILEDSKNGKIVFDANAVTVTNLKDGTIPFSWSDITEIHAYKRDLITTDMICLQFKLRDTDKLIGINEEFEGFYDFQKQMSDKFKGLNANWYMEVTTPPFQENFQTIWKNNA